MDNSNTLSNSSSTVTTKDIMTFIEKQLIDLQDLGFLIFYKISVVNLRDILKRANFNGKEENMTFVSHSKPSGRQTKSKDMSEVTVQV